MKMDEHKNFTISIIIWIKFLTNEYAFEGFGRKFRNKEVMVFDKCCAKKYPRGYGKRCDIKVEELKRNDTPKRGRWKVAAEMGGG